VLILIRHRCVCLPYEEKDRIDDESDEHDSDVPLHGRASIILLVDSLRARVFGTGNLSYGLVQEIPQDELRAESNIDREGNHLDNDAVQHYATPAISVHVSSGRGTGLRASNGLYDERTEVKANENDEICTKFRR
jgi:hypothetical protein